MRVKMEKETVKMGKRKKTTTKHITLRSIWNTR